MTATFSEVDPLDTSTIYPSDASAPAKRYREGATALLTHAGEPISRLFAAPRVDLQVYLEDVQTTPPPDDYRVSTELRAFSGSLGSEAARVVVTSQHDQIPIDDLLSERQGELDNYALNVTFQTVRSTTSTNFWIDVSQRQRERITSISSALFDRLKDRTLGEDSAADPVIVKPGNTYWARDPQLRLIRDSNGNRILAAVNEVAWGQAVKDIALYDDQIEDAYAAATADMDTAYTADDWAALAAIDIDSYAWPLYYTGPVSVGLRIWT